MIRNLGNPCNLKWIYTFCSENCSHSSKFPSCRHFHVPSAKIRHLRNQRALHPAGSLFVWIHSILYPNERQLSGFRGYAVTPAEDLKMVHPSATNIAKAQTALLDYFYSTQGIYFTDAERISKNCPIFVSRMLEKLNGVETIERKLFRFLHYQPINEFEPFFESIGLKPSEYKVLLPHGLLFLSDIKGLVDNYHDLCDYGIAPDKIGKMYREAKDMFMFKPDLLRSKLLAYEKLGFRKSIVIKLVTLTPTLLLGDHINKEFVQLLNSLVALGISQDWFGRSLSEKNACHWGKMLILLRFFKDMGFDEREIGSLILKHPSFLIDCSGKTFFSLISLLLKVGFTRKEFFVMFTGFPHIEVGRFTRNLRRAFEFLVELEMDFKDIQKIIYHHKDILGQICLKRPTSILTNLSTGKKRLCQVINKDPLLLKKFVMGSKVLPLPTSGPSLESSIEKKKEFLSRLGFVENSKEMNDAFEMFRGKGYELQDRFDFFVKNGLDSSLVIDLMKRAPHILNQRIEVLDEKLSFIIHNLGYPLSAVVRLPKCLSCTTQRVKVRHLMYDWLKERGKAKPSLSLGTIIASSDKMFIKRFVSLHPEGPEAWEFFKKAVYSIE